MKLHSILVLLLVALCACDSSDLETRLDSLRQIDATNVAHRSTLLKELIALRPAVLQAHDPTCDALYNNLVVTCTEQLPLDSLDWRSFAENIDCATTLDSVSSSKVTHAQRVWGNYDAVRSLSVRQFHLNSRDDADVLGSIAAEYVRLRYYRAALPYALAADSNYLRRGQVKGRLWSLSLMYTISRHLQDDSGARLYLREFRQIHDNTLEHQQMAEADTATALNLLVSILSLGRTSDLESAFGEMSNTYLRLYQRSQISSGMLVHNSWKQSRSSTLRIPKPIIRAFPAHSIVPVWADSLTFSPDGHLFYDTRFGRYALLGRRWELSPYDFKEPHFWTLNKPKPIISDTLYASRTPIRCVLPIGTDTLIAFTSRNAVVLTPGVSTIQRLDRTLATIAPQLSEKSSAVSIGRNFLLLRHGDTLLLLDRASFQTLDMLMINGSMRSYFLDSDKRNQLQPYALTRIDETSVILGRPNSYDIYSFEVDTIRKRVVHRPLETRYSSALPTSSTQQSALVVTRLAAIATYATSRQQLSLSLLTLRGPILAPYADEFGISRPVQIPSSHGLVAFRMNDHLDIVDTLHWRSYPQLAARFPIEHTGATHIGVFKRKGMLQGYYNDGFTIVRFDLSQQHSRLEPSLFLHGTEHVGRPDQKVVDTATHVQESTPVVVSIQSNMVAFTSPLFFNLSSSSTRSWQSDSTSDFWHIELQSPSTSGTVAFATPLLSRPMIVSIEPHGILIDVFKAVAPILATAIAIVGGLALVRYRKNRRVLAIQHAKSQQLELIREDMHDMIGSRLVRIASLARQTKAENAEEALSRIHDMTLVTVRSLRNLLSLMSETTMTDAEFFGALREYVVESCSDAALTPTVTITTADNDRTTMNGGDRHELMMIVSEMLANTLRHAHATTVSFSILSDDIATTLLWQDDGVGISSSSQRGNGLNNIQRRAVRLNAAVNLISHPGGGTQYTITIPLRTA